MQENYKKHLAWAIIIVLFIFAYAGISYVRTYDKSIEPSSFRSFSVSGEGKKIIVPDVAQFVFSVITEGGKDIGALQTQNTNKTNSAIAFLKDNGIEVKDIKTEGYNLNPRYQYYSCNRPFGSVEPCPPPEIVGYTITQRVSVKVRDFSKIGTVFSGVVDKGANSVSSLSFTVDDEDAAKAEARDEAIGKAKAKAKAIAKEAGFSVGRLLSVQEGYSPYPVYYESVKSMDAAGMGVGGAAPAPSIEAGSQEIIVNVTLIYEIR